MDEYVYKIWKPDMGFEKMQAAVYNEANQHKFKPATAEQISRNLVKNQIKPEHVHYVFMKDKMVGYIQARIQAHVKEIVLSFPWTIHGTPNNVQETLFEEIMTYFRTQPQYVDYRFRVNPFAKPTSNLKFLQAQGFLIENTWRILQLPLRDVASAKYDSKYSSQLGTSENLEELVNLIKKDRSYSKTLQKDDDIKKFITKDLLSTQHLILVFENNKLVSAAAPKEADDHILMDFAAFQDEKDQAPFIPLFVELAKACVKTGFGNSKPILVYTDDLETPKEEREFLRQITPVKSTDLMYYCYLDMNLK